MESNMFDVEHLPRTYFKMTLPVVFGLVITLIYNLADTYFISRTGNTQLIAGVSLCGPIFTIMMAFGNIYGQGGSSLLSRLLGKNEKEQAEKVSSFCFYIAILTGLVIGMLMLLGRTRILKLIGADTETMPYAKSYFTYLVIGAPIIVLSFIHSNLLRCEGKANIAMIGTVGGAIVNIILDPLLIFGLNMGAAGAAIATVIGYLSSDLYFMIIVHNKSQFLSMKPKQMKISGDFWRQIVGIGLTAAITNFMQSLSIILMNQFLLPYGNDKIATMGVVLKINLIPQLILTGFAFGSVPVLGYLFGANNKEKLKAFIRFSMSFCCSLALVFTTVVFVAAPSLVAAFLKEASMLIGGAEMLRWQVLTSVGGAIVLLMTVLYQATGKVLPALILSVSRQGIIYILVLLIMAKLLGYQGIIKAQALSDIVSVLLAIGLYHQVNVTKEVTSKV